jgi:hypothetical protein
MVRSALPVRIRKRRGGVRHLRHSAAARMPWDKAPTRETPLALEERRLAFGAGPVQGNQARLVNGLRARGLLITER